MSQQDQNFDRIEDYLFNKKSDKDKAAFEKEMSENPSLAAEVGQHRLEHDAMKLMLKKDMKARLDALKKNKTQPVEETTKVVPMRRRVFLYAAAASVVGILGFLMMQWLSPVDSGAMADNYFVKESYTVRGGDDSNPSIKSAYDKMKSGNYQDALTDLADVPDSETVLLLKGECYYFLNQFNNATEVYQSLLNSLNEKAKRDKVEWLLALTQLKSKGINSTEFESLINKIINDSNHAFHKEGNKLVRELK